MSYTITLRRPDGRVEKVATAETIEEARRIAAEYVREREQANTPPKEEAADDVHP